MLYHVMGQMWTPAPYSRRLCLSPLGPEPITMRRVPWWADRQGADYRHELPPAGPSTRFCEPPRGARPALLRSRTFTDLWWSFRDGSCVPLGGRRHPWLADPTRSSPAVVRVAGDLGITMRGWVALSHRAIRLLARRPNEHHGRSQPCRSLVSCQSTAHVQRPGPT